MKQSRTRNTSKPKASVSQAPRSNKRRAHTMTALRAFSSFSGPSAGTQRIYASGNFTRKVGEQSYTYPASKEFVASPELNLLGKVSHLFTKGQPLSISSTRTFYLNKDSTAAKVKSLTSEEILKDADAKFTGAPFAWTGAKVTEVYNDGTKVESDIAFDKKTIKIKSVATGKKSYTETGTLDIVSPPEFQARFEDAKKLYANTPADDKSLIQLY